VPEVRVGAIAYALSLSLKTVVEGAIAYERGDIELGVLDCCEQLNEEFNV
jgi:hypothetical protein